MEDLAIRNPPVARLLELDLTVPRALDSLSNPSIFDLLLALNAARAWGELVVKRASEVAVPLEDGHLLLTDEAIPPLVTALHGPAYHVAVNPQAHASMRIGRRRDPREVMAALLREMGRLTPSEELEPIFGRPELGFLHRSGEGRYMPKVNAKERRFLEVVADGSRKSTDVHAVSGLARHLTYQLLAVLLPFRVVEFRPQPGAAGDATFIDEVERDRRRLATGSLFDRVGGHWSDSVRQLRRKYDAFLKKYAPGSQGAEHNPEAAAQVLAMAQDAWRQLESPGGRKAARAQMGNLDMASASGILLKHAEMAAMRAEFDEVLECLEMAVEIHPTAENRGLLDRMRSVAGAARPQT
jgi:hypothetical protein